MNQEEIMEKLVRIKTYFHEKDLLRVFDAMLGDTISNRDYERDIDYLETCIYANFSFKDEQALNEKLDDKEGFYKVCEDIEAVFKPIVFDLADRYSESSKAMFDRLIMTNKINDLPSIYKDKL